MIGLELPTPDYFDTEERSELSEAGRELVAVLESLGITELDDMSIVEPCRHALCRDTVLNLGNLRVDAVRDLVAKLKALAPTDPQ
ncbi:hypothetical protein [Streptomyces aureocirculatus]|uniref:hypothetical protein n=1 Tax=Streptomyces aureocirculatus TaxID=67275 RepID=UPI0004C5FE07|nr:hypothetical protein [Streptomyces aureocirculatus]